jgi:hypothetical protein
MAKRLADVEGLAVVILGGKHHLTKALQKWAPGLRYIRVVTKAYQQAAGEWYGAFRDGCSPRLCERRRTMR